MIVKVTQFSRQQYPSLLTRNKPDRAMSQIGDESGYEDYTEEEDNNSYEYTDDYDGTLLDCFIGSLILE